MICHDEISLKDTNTRTNSKKDVKRRKNNYGFTFGNKKRTYSNLYEILDRQLLIDIYNITNV